MGYRGLPALIAAWFVIFAMLSSTIALAQEGSTDDGEVAVEPSSYGDAELIGTLQTYDLLDEWIAQSPVSPQASLLLVTSGGGYQTQRDTFLDALEAWARRTELVRVELAQIAAAQDNADRLRAITTAVRGALVLDDRLASDSKTLVQIRKALDDLAGLVIAETELGEVEDAVVLAEVELRRLRDLAETELLELNGAAPALASSGVESFVGFDNLQAGLDDVERQLQRGRDLIAPAAEESERLVSFALSQVPSLHAARMVGSTDVGGLSVVTVDAYVRAAERSSCPVDWALLAGIGEVESNHGRIGGASVSSSGQVSTTILGPLLDGGATERAAEQSTTPLDEQLRAQAVQTVTSLRRVALAVVADALRGLLGLGIDAAGAVDVAADAGDQGNGFAVVVDSDGGRLDGNEMWDRAIGPMQFLPETWSKWATDGNGDGAADPHNLYDAAASAARFLCNLRETRGSSPSTFVLGYNASTSYVRRVLSIAQSLRSSSLPVR